MTEQPRLVENTTPIVAAWNQEDSLKSIAISLKRIADALEAFTKGHFTP